MALTVTLSDDTATHLRNLAATYGKTASTLVAKRTPTEAALYIYSPIGEAFGGVSARQVAEALAEIQSATSLTVYVSSEGGDFFEGVAIYSQLVRFAQTHEVTAVVDGLAASAASVIVMGAPKIIMAPSARIMIHEARVPVYGTAAQLRAKIDVLEKANETLAGIYAERTGLALDRIQGMFASGDTYLNAEESVALGFADAIEGEEAKPKAVTACAPAKIKVAATLDTDRQLAVARTNVTSFETYAQDGQPLSASGQPEEASQYPTAVSLNPLQRRIQHRRNVIENEESN